MNLPPLRKDESRPLPDQISDILREKIELGEYPPGKKLKTIRQFATEFAVSPVTVIKALDILEEETLIERVPIKGIFVSGRTEQKKQLTACFAFPEKQLSPNYGSAENWGLNLELFRGLSAGAMQNNVNLQFVYFEQASTPELLKKQLAILEKFDFVVFTGNQLEELQEKAAQQQPVYGIASGAGVLPGVIPVDYDRADAMKRIHDYLKKCSVRSAVSFIVPDVVQNRSEIFVRNAEKEGIALCGNGIFEISRHDPERGEKIKSFLLKYNPEFIFIDTTELITDLYGAAFELGLFPGMDFIVTGISGGMMYNGLFPAPSYFRIPRFDMAMQLMKCASESILSGKTPVVPELEVEFIEGKIFKKYTGEKES